MTIIRWSEVENLPETHPKFIAFQKQIDREAEIHAMVHAVECGDDPVVDDEESYDHFNRYVAGDR